MPLSPNPTQTFQAKYQNTAGTTVTGSFATVPFATKIYDAGGTTVSSGVFTAPSPGLYTFSVALYPSITMTTGQSFGILWLVTSGPESLSGASQIGANSLGNGLGSNTAYAVSDTRQYRLNAGDTVAVQMFSDGTGALALSTTAGRNVFSIAKIGTF